MEKDDIKFSAKHLANKLNLRNVKSEVAKRHKKLKEIYEEDPQKASIIDSAVVEGENLDDPFHSKVLMNDELNLPLKTGLHRAVGGDHDYSTPGDILSAALAVCFESTLRMIADKLEIQLEHTRVSVEASVDVRGTLMFDKSVPVGFQKMNMEVELGSNNAGKKILNTLYRAALKSCVVYQTLKSGIPVSKTLKIV
ncbi:OsmC family protein [Rhodohalobacter sp.]|uniref:OsmC family protein n=1 Tax=Rhodohalobacter sp. TaxID=1974210 RepID=UPI002ACE4242|nr:OsmC family protein [Rhodohalobacter sp.]MDZ7754869.1 OsmC family protein [Rhodohalobacter sp.]